MFFAFKNRFIGIIMDTINKKFVGYQVAYARYNVSKETGRYTKCGYLPYSSDSINDVCDYLEKYGRESINKLNTLRDGGLFVGIKDREKKIIIAKKNCPCIRVNTYSILVLDIDFKKVNGVYLNNGKTIDEVIYIIYNDTILNLLQSLYRLDYTVTGLRAYLRLPDIYRLIDKHYLVACVINKLPFIIDGSGFSNNNVNYYYGKERNIYKSDIAEPFDIDRVSKLPDATNHNYYGKNGYINGFYAQLKKDLGSDIKALEKNCANNFWKVKEPLSEAENKILQHSHLHHQCEKEENTTPLIPLTEKQIRKKFKKGYKNKRMSHPIMTKPAGGWDELVRVLEPTNPKFKLQRWGVNVDRWEHYKSLYAQNENSYVSLTCTGCISIKVLDKTVTSLRKEGIELTLEKRKQWTKMSDILTLCYQQEGFGLFLHISNNSRFNKGWCIKQYTTCMVNLVHHKYTQTSQHLIKFLIETSGYSYRIGVKGDGYTFDYKTLVRYQDLSEFHKEWLLKKYKVNGGLVKDVSEHPKRISLKDIELSKINTYDQELPELPPFDFSKGVNYFEIGKKGPRPPYISQLVYLLSTHYYTSIQEKQLFYRPIWEGT